jgi:hypothetical protein
MPYEISLTLRFEDYVPDNEDIEDALDCIIVERTAEEEV